MSWAESARATIARVHASLSPDAPLADRKAAIDAAYPFGVRGYSPYKTWLRARRAYLCQYGYKPRNAPHETLLERMMRRAER